MSNGDLPTHVFEQGVKEPPSEHRMLHDVEVSDKPIPRIDRPDSHFSVIGYLCNLFNKQK